MMVAVASGKGGTGKTTVSVNLALSLLDDGPVQVLDCDVEEPNCHLFLRPTLTETEQVSISVPAIDEGKCSLCGQCAHMCAFHALAVVGHQVLGFPELCHGCGVCSIACPVGAISEKPRRIGVIEIGLAHEISFVHGKLDVGAALAPPVIKAVKGRARNDGAVIIDAPPGTSCPVVNSVAGADYCVLVTEPTPFGLNDLTLAAGMVRKLGVPFGVVINRSGANDECIERYCDQEGIPVLLKIPFDRRFAAAYARGQSLVDEFPEWKQSFRNLWQKIEKNE